MQLDICEKHTSSARIKNLYNQLAYKPVDNLQQTSYQALIYVHQAGSSDAKASGYQLDDCQVTSLQLTSGCVVSHVALSVFFLIVILERSVDRDRKPFQGFPGRVNRNETKSIC